MGKYDMVTLEQIDTDSLTFADIRTHYGTGRAYTISGSGRDRKTGYRKGFMTDVGDLEISDWKKLAYMLIKRAGEEDYQRWLIKWTVRNATWLHNQADWETYSLESHVARLFDNPAWEGYEAFNRKFRPELLDPAKEQQIKNERSLHNNECE